MTTIPPDPFSDLRYRIVCYEIDGTEETMILDTTARGYIIATGTINENGTMQGHANQAGPLHLRRRLAAVIADDDQLAN
jgi:hypothetical protein